ncbi:tetratricopeptide repeat protein [Streptomyces cellulosae]|uniref:HTH cro/C1-type domain-containing protein n=1 Tax=Streptomyces cellulosae TaxID=1968 RepID=A0ABW7Y3T7_STRCE
MSERLSELRLRLQRIRREAGDPSTREISRKAHGAVSHTTAHHVLRAETVPSWGSLEPVVVALGGDVAEFKKLWIAARDHADAGSENIVQGADPRYKYRDLTAPYVAARLNLVGIYHTKGEHEKCLELLFDWAGSPPPDATMLGELCSLHLYGEYNARVRERYSYEVRKDVALKAQIEDVDTIDSCFHWARFCEGIGRMDRALSWAAQARCINPHSPRAMRIQADIMMTAGRYSEAADLFLKAHELDSGFSVGWHVSLRDALKVTGRLDELAKVCKGNYERAVATKGNSLFHLTDYLSALRVSGNFSEARRVGLTLKEYIVDGKAPGYCRIEYAELMEDLGQIEEAKWALKGRSGTVEDEDVEAAYANLIYRVEGAEAAASLLAEWAERY